MGENHDHMDRMTSSKMNRLENRAKLYLTYKDHKKEPGKTRPIGTANTSNTRGFANCVSELLEAVASAEVKKFEVISTEDMLHQVGTHNNKVGERKEEWLRKRKKKEQCLTCKP